jgi:hypothetical protein
MGESATALIRPLALALWGSVLLSSSLSGRLDLLLRGAFHPLVGVSGVLLLALAIQQANRPSPSDRRSRRRWSLSCLLALAVLLVPPNPSFSDLAANRSGDPGGAGDQQPGLNSSCRRASAASPTGCGCCAASPTPRSTPMIQ